jgi:hypothetical protein
MQQGGIHQAVVRSPAVAIIRRTLARSPPPGPHPSPAINAAALLFLLPLLSLIHLALSSGPNHHTPHPCQELREPPRRPPLPPDGYNDANNQRSVDAASDPLREDERLRATQSALLLSPPPRAGGCMRGAEHQSPVTPGIAQPLHQVPPHGCSSS